MRNLILLGIVSFSVLLGGALCINWFVRSSALEKAVEQQIAALNSADKIFSYEALKTSGFPLDMTVSIVRPRFVGRLDKLLAPLAPNPRALPEWNADITLDGSVDVSSNALSDHFQMTMRGNWINHFSVAGRNQSIVGQTGGESSCSVQLSRNLGSDLWNFTSLQNPADIAGRLQLVDCLLQSNQTVQAESKAILSRSGGARLYLSAAPQNGRINTRLYLLSKDWEITPAGEKLFGQYAQWLGATGATAMLKANGKQNMEIDLAYNGASDWHNGNAFAQPLEIQLNKLAFSSPLFEKTARLHIASTPTAGSRTINLSYQADGQVHEGWRAATIAQLQGAAAQLLSSTEPTDAELKTQLASLPPDTLNQVIADIVPDPTFLGKAHSAIELSYSASTDGADNTVGANSNSNTLATSPSANSQWQTNLSKWEFTADPYSVVATASLTKEAAQPAPTGSATIHCTHCTALLSDTLNYGLRLRNALALISPEAAATPAPSPAFAQGALNFFTALSEPSNQTDRNAMHFDITSHGAEGLAINGLNSAAIMQLYQQHLAPVL